jgi:HK97 family phage major capsid protein
MSGFYEAAELRAKRRTLWEQQKVIRDAAAADNRVLSAEERTQWDAIDVAMDAIKTQVDRIEKHEDNAKELEASLALAAARRDDGASPDQVRDETHKAREVRCKWIAFGPQSLTPEERQLLPNPVRVSDDGASGVPLFRLAPVAPNFTQRQMLQDGRRGGGLELRDLTSGAAAASTTETVPDEAMRTLESALLAYGGMRRARTTILRTATGAALPIPTDDDTGNTGQILGEGSEETNFTDPTMSEKILYAYKYSSKFIRVSLEFLQDTMLNADAWLAGKLGTRIGRITNTHFTTGHGSSRPLGVENGTIGVTAASASAITHNELLDLKHAVDPAYRTDAEWMFRDATLKALKQLKDSQGRPLWAPGIAVREPDTIDGDRYVVNQDVDAITGGGRSVIYGDFSKYWIRDVMDIAVQRLVERYAEFGKVAFIAFSRHDGDIIDAGTNPIKYLRHPAS